ncbi:uncharacterized protein LOC131945146 [Physella acuta]|uniref:uncharacterized protein LOC131945146 n=1 Tax=Physella acuta TaxID=109671 RepID=UPI0027DBE0CD|nr:uncharacterized protein LOC131945146 [Physella acuta]
MTSHIRHKGNKGRLAQILTSRSDTQRHTAGSDDVISTTPYRLPRIASSTEKIKRPESRDLSLEKMFGRHGYEYIIRLPDLTPLQPGEFISPQRLLSQRSRQLPVPTGFNNVTASCRNTPSLYGEDDGDDETFDDILQRDHVTSDTRTTSPAVSIQSIHWALGQQRNGIFDTTGRSHLQGPFSRSFTVRCRAPPTWMKMKWGRSRTFVH